MSKKLVCPIKDVPCDGMKAFDAEGGKRVLIANAGSEYFAYQHICPHQDVALEEGMYDGNVLTCHQHLWQWDIRTGSPMGLAEAPLEYYETKVEDGNLYIIEPSALKVAELFIGISARTMDLLIDLATNQEVEEGGTLYSPGDLADDIYILQSGRVNFVIGREGRTTPAGFKLRKGELFGWAALLEHTPHRIATATCLEKSHLLRLNGKRVLGILQNDPAAGYLVMRRLSSLITRYLTTRGAE